MNLAKQSKIGGEKTKTTTTHNTTTNTLGQRTHFAYKIDALNAARCYKVTAVVLLLFRIQCMTPMEM